MDTKFGRLSTEQVNIKTKHIDICNTREMLELINDEDMDVPSAVRKEISNIVKAVDVIADHMKKGGRLFYIGAGTSGRIGILDASECPPTFGTSPDLVQGIIAGGSEAICKAVEGVEDDEALGGKTVADRQIRYPDVVVGITASGRTPFVIGAIREARKNGVMTIGISNTTGSRIQREADLAITPIVGSEVIMGSTRMKAGTSQKLVLNMITTSVMIKLGKVYGNLMVDVQPSNLKLVDRSVRITMHATGLAYEDAKEYLKLSGSSPKIAIIMAKTGLGRSEAEELLKRSEGFVTKALDHISAEAGK